jgi:branched-chain amino acid transport system permease protein
MSSVAFIEQTLNGVQLGVMLFLMAAGLTLVFGIMNLINLSHGSFYMIGAFIASSVVTLTGSFLLATAVALIATALVAACIELSILRRICDRGHLDQVMVTIGLIFIFDEVTRMIWGVVPVALPVPRFLSASVEVLPGVMYPALRLAVLIVGILVAALLYFVVGHTRAGMWMRAGASDRTMALALGVDVPTVSTIVFAAGAALAGLAGVMAGPIVAVQIGMGEPVLILALVVMVIGGIGSVRGAFFGAIVVGLVDTFGRVLLPSALGSMVIFLFMAAVLAYKPTGLFPAHD